MGSIDFDLYIIVPSEMPKNGLDKSLLLYNRHDTNCCRWTMLWSLVIIPRTINTDRKLRLTLMWKENFLQSPVHRKSLSILNTFVYPHQQSWDVIPMYN